jgi:hypothetical protein
MTSINWEEITTPLKKAARQLRIAVEKAQAASLSDGTFKDDLALLAEESLDLYQQSVALKIRAEVQQSVQGGST